MKQVNRTEVCEECGTVEPKTDTEVGSDYYDRPFGDTGSWEHWKRYHTICCDADVIMMSDDDIEDSVFGDLPDLIEFAYNPEDLRACCMLSFDQKHFNLMLHHLNPINWRLSVIHPDMLEVHNWRCPKERIHSEAMLYDWIETILEAEVKYSSDHLTTYEVLLNHEKYTMKIFWVL